MRDLSQDWNPAPKFREKRPKKAKKRQRMKGRVVPNLKERGRIDKKNAEQALQNYKHQCGGCGYGGEALELHHILFRSAGGRKCWRNLVPLCRRCHDACHGKFQNKADRLSYGAEYNQYWVDKHTAKYGPHFGSDVFDLFGKGLVPNTTPEAYESFMTWEQAKRTANHT